MIIELKGFGSARKLSGVKIDVAAEANIADLRLALLNKLKDDNDDDLIIILQTCAFANQAKVLDENELLECNSIINILPPVCGG